MPAAQTRPDGRLHHLLTLDGLPRPTLVTLLDRADALREVAAGRAPPLDGCRRRTVLSLFFEASTRTRVSFELAACRLGATVVDFDLSLSSTRKGESTVDTLRTIEAMGVDLFVVRHGEDGAVARLAQHARPDTHLVNAGDGRSAHPTQGLLDMLTIRRHKGADFSRLRVAIVGDIAHSRVARSDITALRTLGVGELRVCAPPALLPASSELDGCIRCERVEDALADCDVAMTLRLQRERMEEGLVGSLEDYFRDYGLTPERMALARPDAIVMHPGPMNRGVEIAEVVADGPQSVILEQVTNGVAVRMAVIEALLAA